MNVKWKRLLVKIIIWLTAEIALNLVGLDDLADYSEFIFEKHVIVHSHPIAIDNDIIVLKCPVLNQISRMG